MANRNFGNTFKPFDSLVDLDTALLLDFYATHSEISSLQTPQDTDIAKWQH